MSADTLHHPPVRPSEKTLRYLQNLAMQQEVRPGDRLPSMRTISAELGVSATTVRNVYERLASQGVIRMQVGDGSYWHDTSKWRKKQKFSQTLIGFNLPDKPAKSQDWNGWAYRILSGMIKSSFESAERLHLEPFGLDYSHTEAHEQEILQHMRSVSAICLLPLKENKYLARLAYDCGIPVIHLNPKEAESTSDFVSFSYYKGSRIVGQIWRETKKKRILFLTSPNTRESTSGELRLAGLAAGLGDAIGKHTEFRILALEQSDTENTRIQFSSFLSDTQWIPDAIYSSGDKMIVGAMEVLQERGYLPGQHVSIIGGNGMSTADPSISTVTALYQPLEVAGEKLVQLAMNRLRAGTPQPGIYVPFTYSTGNTASPIEERMLKELLAEHNKEN